MVIGGHDQLSRAEVLDRLQHVEYKDVDLQVELMFQEVEDRATWNGYPFQRDGELIRPTGANTAVYEPLLYLSTSPFVRKNPGLKAADRIFERLVEMALASYLGGGSTNVLFGYPPAARPSKFPAAIKWLRVDQMGLAPAEPALAADSAWNDGGLDVAGWIGFGDGRVGFVTLLVQATISRTEWQAKTLDVVPSIWRDWLRLASDPLNGLAIPFAIPAASKDWEVLSRKAAVLFDRERLLRLLPAAVVDPLGPIAVWTAAERQRLALP